ncbi:MAG: hypothetical protein JWR50_3008 [Mucilaginibacter sp.]|nr:hypothetical protein [Mucilaginibacter sp.]
MRTYEKTTNGIEYIDEIASSEGASFVLFPTAGHTPEMIKEAIREIFDNRDVVSLKVANERDWNERYRTEIFAHPLICPLKWYEVNTGDYDQLRRERLKGTAIEEYIKQYVLPFTAETKAKNLKKYGNEMYGL